MNWLPPYNYILASKSPRRHELLKILGIDFQVKLKEIEEVFPEGLSKEEIPVYLVELKAKQFLEELDNNDMLITADTIVWFNGQVLGKPENYDKARAMLEMLSNNKHQVISGVCLTTAKKQVSFFAVSNVWFKPLSNAEIEYYITNFKPFDKAGAYGIQEWIGATGITHIEGSFYNVMGLPIQRLYEEIIKF
ncbi:MAG: Maf family nucleotide pyrophosphatase [Bacteroidales bacterium]|jgi:septum formation protein|nr:Maf family nucleotide pyrophosphatase [Bacteroidales bacterium]